MTSRHCGWFQSGAGSPAGNMAVDEAMLQSMPRRQQPLLRFYSWTVPAASFGYFQHHAEIEALTQLRPLVRRPTGGGLVSHLADWTYSVAFPASDPWYELKAAESYQRIHEWLRAAFGALDFSTELALSCHRAGPGQCFIGHEKFDLLWQGKKIAGAAQRRSRDGLLIQGSVQPPAPIFHRRTDWEAALLAVGDDEGFAAWHGFSPDAEFKARCAELEFKYNDAAYNQKR